MWLAKNSWCSFHSSSVSNSARTKNSWVWQKNSSKKCLRSIYSSSSKSTSFNCRTCNYNSSNSSSIRTKWKECKSRSTKKIRKNKMTKKIISSNRKKLSKIRRMNCYTMAMMWHSPQEEVLTISRIMSMKMEKRTKTMMKKKKIISNSSNNSSKITFYNKTRRTCRQSWSNCMKNLVSRQLSIRLVSAAWSFKIKCFNLNMRNYI